MWRPLIILLFTGCVGLEYLNPEDTGNVPGPGTGPGTGPSDSGGSGNSQYNNPSVESFAISETESKVRMDFVVSDSDQDMNGGTIEVGIGNRQLNYAFPDEIMRESGDTFLLFSKSEFTPEQQVKCSLTATDSRGLSSSTVSQLFTLSSSSLQVPENGDDASAIYALGMLSPPVEITGSIWGAGNLGGLYDADLDFVSFQVPQSRQYNLELTWTPTSADYDLHLIEGTGTTLAYSTTYSQPETINYALNANTDYFFTVAAWEGSAGNWTVRIQ